MRVSEGGPSIGFGILSFSALRGPKTYVCRVLSESGVLDLDRYSKALNLRVRSSVLPDFVPGLMSWAGKATVVRLAPKYGHYLVTLTDKSAQMGIPELRFTQARDVLFEKWRSEGWKIDSGPVGTSSGAYLMSARY